MKRLLLGCWLGWAGSGIADQVNGILLPFAGGDNPHATDMAEVICGDDGHGPTDYLFAQVRDDTGPVPNPWVSLQLIKGNQAANTTDQIPGDGQYSEPILLTGGDGVYRMLVNKTGAGIRLFSVQYHCIAQNGAHTGTEIVVRQVQ